MNDFYDEMFESILNYLPDFFDWYGKPMCAMTAQHGDEMFSQAEQAFYQSMATIRLRSYRSKIGLSNPRNRIITDPLIDEAKKLANARQDCFPLVEEYRPNRELFLGQAAAYVGYLQKAYVVSRIRSRPTDDQDRRLREARTYFRRAQDLLERYQDNERRTRLTGSEQPKSANSSSRLQTLTVSAAERNVLSGAGAAGPELARITRALNAIDQLVGEE